MFSELRDCKIPECHEMSTVVKVGHKSIDHERERENNSDESFLCLTNVSPTPVLLIL